MPFPARRHHPLAGFYWLSQVGKAICEVGRRLHESRIQASNPQTLPEEAWGNPPVGATFLAHGERYEVIANDGREWAIYVWGYRCSPEAQAHNPRPHQRSADWFVDNLRVSPNDLKLLVRVGSPRTTTPYDSLISTDLDSRISTSLAPHQPDNDPAFRARMHEAQIADLIQQVGEQRQEAHTLRQEAQVLRQEIQAITRRLTAATAQLTSALQERDALKIKLGLDTKPSESLDEAISTRFSLLEL